MGKAGAVVLLSLLSLYHAQAEPVTPPRTVPVLLTSDIHFEPFWDPGKVQKLAAAPVDRWAAILSSPDSPNRQQRFAGLEQQCHARGADTSYPLLRSSLAAMRKYAGRPAFITVSGNLISHVSRCKFYAVLPHASAAEYPAFVEKTIEFVLLELRGSFPGTPVFPALGNNDTPCGHNHLDADSAFLHVLAPAVTADVQGPLRRAARASFSGEGDYVVDLPAPFHDTQLMVLDNLFEFEPYQTCAGKPDLPAGRRQLAWLQGQLQAARRKHEQVWVVGHVPPGINGYATARKALKVCQGQPPAPFLTSNASAETLADFADVVRLAIFGHTHMNEFRLLRVQSGGAGGLAVPVKIVPSITGIGGNDPSFVVAQVEPASATLKDYRVIAASNKTGIGTRWAEEYDFDREYHEPAFNARSLAQLIGRFSADRSAVQAASRDYLAHYSAGARTSELKPYWPVCVRARQHQCRGVSLLRLRGRQIAPLRITSSPSANPVQWPGMSAQRCRRGWGRIAVLAAAFLGAPWARLFAQAAEPPAPAAAPAAAHAVVLIALSGMRWDDPARTPAPHLLAIARQGAWAPQGMLPVFPAETAPNLFTIATGLYPGHHGIVADAFQDPQRHAQFIASDARIAADASWYSGTPLWSLAEKQGMRTACIGWIGCTAEISGARPTYHATAKPQEAAMLRQVLDWLRLPAARRPRLIAIAMDEPGREAREFGPDAPQTRAAVRSLDSELGKFYTELKATGQPVDVVIVSDRGFARPEGRWITLSRYAQIPPFQHQGLLLYAPAESDRVRMYDQLKKATSEFVAYRRKDLPASLHMNASPRLGDPVVVARGAYALRVAATASDSAEPRAVDGLDPAMVPDMKAVFIAAGPDIVAGKTVRPFENVNLYPWIAHLLGLHVPKNDGDLNILSATLRDNGGPEN